LLHAQTSGSPSVLNDDFVPSANYGSSTGSLHSVTTPSFSKHAPAGEALGLSLTSARDDLFNPGFLSSSSARAYLSVPSNPHIAASPYASQPTLGEGRNVKTVPHGVVDENASPDGDGVAGSRYAKQARYVVYLNKHIFLFIFTLIKYPTNSPRQLSNAGDYRSR
jgi:hypothetical protein